MPEPRDETSSVLPRDAATPDAGAVPVENIHLRDVLAALPAYVPGKPAPDDGLHRFKVSSNESPFPPLPAVREAVVRALETGHLYPDMSALPLKEAIADQHADQGVPVAAENVAVSTGSVAVLGDLVRALVDPGDEVVYAWRSFEAYPISVGSHGGVPVQVPLTTTFEHDLDAMADAVGERTRLVLLCTPNNPTGPALGTTQLEDFLARVPDHVVVAIDEAYREFVEPDQVADTGRLFAEHGNVVLLRTFSKLQGLAGLRIGYALAHPRLATALGKVTVPFGTSSLAQAAALATFDPVVADELEQRAAWIRVERRRAVSALASQGWELPDTQGNFVYLPLGSHSSEFARFADDHGLVVRAYGDDGVRVTIAEQDANDRFVRIAGAWHADRT